MAEDPYGFINTTEPDDDVQEENLDYLEKELAPNPIDYYTVLNVSRTATEDEIKESYKRLCRVFHPDKHVEEDKKRAAETQFQIIQRAYEVLTDQTKRTIYDMYGEEGLKQNWEIGPKLKTPEEMRAEYEKQARLQREAQLESLVHSKGDFQFNIDATRVFNPYVTPNINPLYLPQSRPTFKPRYNSALGYLTKPFGAVRRAEIQQLYMKHSFEAPLGPQTLGTVAGSMLARNGIGGGNLVGTIRHTWSPRLWSEFGTSLISPRILNIRTFYNIDTDTFINIVANTTYSFPAPPPLTVTCGRALYPGITGYLTYRTGEYSIGSWGPSPLFRRAFSSVALGISSTSQRKSYTMELQTGIVQSGLSGNYEYKLVDSTRIRISGGLTVDGNISISVGGDRKISEHARLGFALEASLAGSVTLKLRLSRLGQRIIIPFLLSTEFVPALAFWGAVIPAMIAVVVDHAYAKPRRRQKIQQKIKEIREQHAEYIANQKRESEEARLLLQDMAARKMAVEDQKNGLVILEAIYGNLNPTKEQVLHNEESLVVDVTVVVQALVNDSKLTIPAGHSKAGIMGFYDPCMGEKKKLRVRYRFQHQLHEITVDDSTALTAPMRSHAVTESRF